MAGHSAESRSVAGRPIRSRAVDFRAASGSADRRTEQSSRLRRKQVARLCCTAKSKVAVCGSVGLGCVGRPGAARVGCAAEQHPVPRQPVRKWDRRRSEIHDQVNGGLSWGLGSSLLARLHGWKCPEAQMHESGLFNFGNWRNPFQSTRPQGRLFPAQSQQVAVKTQHGGRIIGLLRDRQ